MKKKLLAVLLAGTMTVTLGACGGASDSGSKSDDAAATEAGDDAAANTTASKDAIRFMNTKIEIDAQLKEFAKQYQEKTGQEVVVESLGGGVDVNGQLKNYYAAGNMPDIFAFGVDSYKSSFSEWLEPLDGEAWIEDTDYEFKGDDGKVYGVPFALEGVGVAYNKDILDKAGIDPATLTNIDAYKAAFEKIDGMKDELGLQAVCSVAAESGQMNWSTGNHMMAAYYSQGLDRDDKTYIDMVNNEGKIDEERMGQFADWVKLLFTYADQNVLISGTYDDQLALWATGKAAFITQGNWIDPSLPDYDATFECGLAPAAFSTEDTDGLLIDAPAYWGIYNGSDKIDACKEFLTALVQSEEGQKALVEDCGIVSPYLSCTLEPATPLAKSMLPYIKEGKTYAWDWSTQPEGIAQNATGAVFELYAKDQLDKDGFVSTMASTIADYVAANGSN
ncbi:MAG: ABC transporter substrate-binding protein [Blautia sp.]